MHRRERIYPFRLYRFIFIAPIQIKKSWNIAVSGLFGGDEGDRTPYLLNAIQALSQVSYTPEWLYIIITYYHLQELFL